MVATVAVLVLWMCLGLLGSGWLNFLIRGGSRNTPLHQEDVQWLRVQFLVAIIVGPVALVVCALIAALDDTEFGLTFKLQ